MKKSRTFSLCKRSCVCIAVPGCVSTSHVSGTCVVIVAISRSKGTRYMLFFKHVLLFGSFK